jgi:ABC-type sugar transport system substrate-binding protein
MRVTRPRRRLLGTAALAAAGLLLAACSSSSSSTSAPSANASTSAGASTSAPAQAASGQVTIGVDLTYNNTAFWAAYINYEQQYAAQMHIKLLGPLLSAASASLQNQQIETLVNEGAQAIVVNPETATSLGPAISYAAAHHVQLVSVDTIVGVGHVYMVVRASNTLYGQDACAYIASQVKSGYVLDLEGDLTSSNGADRTDAFDSCMASNDPGVKVLKDPTVWTDATAVTDAQDAINAYGSQLKAIYSQWSSPDTGIIPLLKSKNYAVDAAKGVKLAVGQPGGGAPALANVSYQGDTNLADPIVAPFVTKSAATLTLTSPVDGLPGSVTTTPVSDASLWGNVYGSAHGGVCSSS